MISEKDETLNAIFKSTSWKISKPVRVLGSKMKKIIRSRFFLDMKLYLSLIRSAIRLAVQAEFKQMFNKILKFRVGQYKTRKLLLNQRVRSIGIITTRHTSFISNLFVKNLEDCGFIVSVYKSECPPIYDLDMYFVICPQMFNSLPPGEKRICFQMEQSVSSRWFTDEYFSILENSTAVFDYSFDNLKFLDRKAISYPLTYLLPVGGYVDYLTKLELDQLSQSSKTCDVLFFGDTNVARRKDLLAFLGSRFNVRVLNNVFGADLYKEILSAKIVINLHYYEGALLETTRIYECLSLGIPVVSEASVDINSHELLHDVVGFFPVGDKEAMVLAVEKALRQDSTLMDNKIKKVVNETSEHFSFMFYRALYSLKLISHQQWDILSNQFTISSNCLALSMPETVNRRMTYLSVQPESAVLFNGLRFQPGWIGCALSYKYLANKALKSKFKQLEVMEDDVIFSNQYAERREVVDKWLKLNSGKWDVFAGVIADIHKDTKVLKVEVFQGVQFVTINRMTSTVHNIYSEKLLKVLAEWNPKYEDATKNTIDRYIQSKVDIKVVITLPFLVGHRDDVNSSLWGFNNSQYNDWIARAELALFDLVADFK